MPQTVSFDECFQTVPKLDPPSDLDSFWKEGISELKKSPNQSNIQNCFERIIYLGIAKRCEFPKYR